MFFSAQWRWVCLFGNERTSEKAVHWERDAVRSCEKLQVAVTLEVSKTLSQSLDFLLTFDTEIATSKLASSLRRQHMLSKKTQKKCFLHDNRLPLSKLFIYGSEFGTSTCAEHLVLFQSSWSINMQKWIHFLLIIRLLA